MSDIDPKRCPNPKEHLARLTLAMAPDPRAWRYTGMYEDTGGLIGRCACGHQIRHIFFIERPADGAKLPIGSTCIGSSIPYLLANGAGELAGRLEEAATELKRKMEEETRRRGAEEKRAEIRTLAAYAGQLAGWFQFLRKRVEASFLEAVKSGRRAPYQWPPYWRDRKYMRIVAFLPAATPGRTAAALKQRLRTFLFEAADLEKHLARHGLGACWVEPPVSAEIDRLLA